MTVNVLCKVTLTLQKQQNAPAVAQLSTLSKIGDFDEPFGLQDPFFPFQLFIDMRMTVNLHQCN